MALFDSLEHLPPDAIFGLNQAYLADSRSDKVNLGVGIYHNADLKPVVLETVRKAEAHLLKEALPKTYLPIDGDGPYLDASLALIFGEEAPLINEGRYYAAQAVGGTGALRLAGDLLAGPLNVKQIYLPDPTWMNHKGIFKAARLEVEYYPYLKNPESGVDFEALCEAIEKMPRGSAILLHACCHNPTGVDLSLEQWKELADRIQRCGIIPLFDCAYQGFGEGVEQDAAALRLFSKLGIEFLLAYSYSKNMGLYAERTALFCAFLSTPASVPALRSQVRVLIRQNYSNPPCHGARIVRTILMDGELRREWKGEVDAMRMRVQEMRSALASSLLAEAKGIDFRYLESQKGLFSYTGLSREQVNLLTQEFGIYMPASGRINVTGLNSRNLPFVVDAICNVL